MGQYRNLKVEKKEHIGIVTLSSEPVNTLTFELLDELEACFSDLEKENEIWTVVLCSDRKVFCAGADVRNLASCDRYKNIATGKRFRKAFQAIEKFPHPVIAAVDGIAFGGGFEMALSCDLRVFSTRAKVGFPEVGLGIIPGAGGTQRLTRLIGAGKAKRLIYTAELIKGEEAYRIGACEYLTEPGQAEAEAENIAKTICMKAPVAVSIAKACIDFAADNHSLSDGLDFEIYNGSDVFATEDQKEGTVAFLEKRAPVFHNR